MLTDQLETAYRHLTAEAGYVILPSPTIIRLTGGDRLSFLHNFCTADIKALQPGRITEAFILNTKGKLLGHVHVLAFEDHLLLFTVADQFSVLHEHLDRYVIREDVQIANASGDFSVVFVTGNHQAGRLSEVVGHLPAKNESKHHSGEFVQVVASLELAGRGYLILTQPHAEPLRAEFESAGIVPGSEDALEIVRIENATPRFGTDATNANLPQELQREDKAISFDKGCYLGQETVARIDALGHVNQLLVQLEFDAEVAAGTELVIDDKKAGTVTSTCWSPAHESWLGLGYVRRAHAKEGAELTFDGGKAKVV